MIKDVSAALAEGKHLIADAPTGLGKTAAALFPAVEYAVANGKSVFFLTSRLSQHKMAVETLKIMRKDNAFSAIDVVGKRHLCSHDVADLDTSTFSSFCSALIKQKRCAYYNNFKQVDLGSERSRMMAVARDKILSTQESMKLFSSRYCTYEMLMDAARRADVVIGDYFHLFIKGEKFLKRMNKELSDSIIIVDEAHNLAPRLRASMSSKISQRTCALAADEAEEQEETGDYAREISGILKNLGTKLVADRESFIKREDFLDRVSELGNCDKMIAKLMEVALTTLEEKKKSHCEKLAGFLAQWKGEDFGYARILSRDRFKGRDYLSLSYDCLDPSLVSRSIVTASHSTILMSGTLSPMEMHRDLLGLEPGRTEMKSYPSPFPKHNRRNIIVKGITTQYKERTDRNYARMAYQVKNCIEAIRGNAAVFFPSYDIRDRIYKLTHFSKPVILEDSKMTKEDRDRVKEKMSEHAESGVILMGVLAGSFSEGIDLPGNLLNGVVIVGLPLERPNLSVNSLIDYYDQRFQKGRDYGYNYPAMIKVMQAAGRCIRSETDRGVIVFMDERFTWANYKRIFPRTWDFAVTDTPEEEIRKFFA